MTDRRNPGWASLPTIAGGLAMFLIEVLVIAALVALAFILSALVLAMF